jgi:hypothetical protein
MEIHLGERMAKEDLGLRHIWREEVTQENLGWRYVVGKRWLVRTWDGGTLGRTWHWRVWDGDTCQRGNTQRSSFRPFGLHSVGPGSKLSPLS